MPIQFVIELRNKTTLWVDQAQAEVIDAAWSAKRPVRVQGSVINTVDLVGIWSSEAWYINHPEDKPQPELEEPLYLPPAAETEADSPYRQAWWETLRRNKALLVAGQKPRWTVEHNQIVERDNFWEKGLKAEPTKAVWAKKRFSSKQWNSTYSKKPGFHFLASDGSDIWTAFTRVLDDRPLPENIEECEPAEVELLDRRLAV